MAVPQRMDELIHFCVHRDHVARPGFDLGAGRPTSNGRLVADRHRREKRFPACPEWIIWCFAQPDFPGDAGHAGWNTADPAHRRYPDRFRAWFRPDPYSGTA